MTLAALIDDLLHDSDFLRHVTWWERLPAQPARLTPLPEDLDPRLAAALRSRGIESLYTHQATAWEAAARGENLVVVTPSASGKTLCYNLPVVHALLSDPDARALYIFPTKALAQDQLAELARLEQAIQQQETGSDHSARPSRLAPAVYDGDTPRRERSHIRQQARIVLTNPDMLHVGVLPYHPRWATFFANLRYVVLDELHSYRGVFGSHVANVLRRLRRICAFHGSAPRFLCASATIANPQELAQRLLEAPVTLIANDGSPKGERHILFYNPPLVNPELGLRRSSILEAEAIAARLVAVGVQTVVFARSRLTVEVLLTYLRQRLQRLAAASGRGPGDDDRGLFRWANDPAANRADEAGPASLPDLTASIRGYRGGYLPTLRREIERGLHQGHVRAVVATNALELGVDIGGLEAAVLVGFPGTIASTWQQAGRAGRRTGASLAVLVATAGAQDQYIVNHPEYFFERSPEHALINPDNLVILSSHLACAAYEHPLQAGERFADEALTREVLCFLAEEGKVQRHGDRWFWIGEDHPAQNVSLRTASPDRVVIQVEGADGSPARAPIIGELEREAAPFLLHEGAIYWHEGESYLVERLDWEAGLARVRPVNVDYYTRANVHQQVKILDIHEQTLQGGLFWAYGPVQVISRVHAYRRIKLRTHETLDYGQVDLPPQVLETEAYWLALGEEVLAPLRAAGQWRSDPNDYGPNWPRQREAARARDGYRCVLCGTAETPGREHDVHHKKPFRSFGYIPGFNHNYRQANALDNLVTLCRSCHQRVERGRRLRTGLGGLAYVLGSIAPLYLMCDPGDIGVVSEARASWQVTDGQGSGANRRSSGRARREMFPAAPTDQPTSQPARQLPTITIYEKVPAGIGFSQRLYALHGDLLRAAGDLVRRCPCKYGCPACVGPIGDAQDADVDAKALTLALVEACLSP